MIDRYYNWSFPYGVVRPDFSKGKLEDNFYLNKLYFKLCSDLDLGVYWYDSLTSES